MTKTKFTDVELAEQANTAHREVIAAQLTAIHAAKRAGDALLAAKRIVDKNAGGKKGAWTPWLEANFTDSVQTARVYMRIAKRWTQLQDELSSTPNLSLIRALEILKVKPEPRDTAKNRINGRTCREAMVSVFRDFVNTELSDSEAIFLSGFGDFIVEHYCQFFFSFLGNVREEVTPVAERYVEAKRRWAAGLDELIRSRTDTDDSRARLEKECAREIAFAFRNDSLTAYQRKVIFAEVQHAKSVVPRDVLSHYVQRHEEGPEDWVG